MFLDDYGGGTFSEIFLINREDDGLLEIQGRGTVRNLVCEFECHGTHCKLCASESGVCNALSGTQFSLILGSRGSGLWSALASDS